MEYMHSYLVGLKQKLTYCLLITCRDITPARLCDYSGQLGASPLCVAAGPRLGNEVTTTISCITLHGYTLKTAIPVEEGDSILRVNIW